MCRDILVGFPELQRLGVINVFCNISGRDRPQRSLLRLFRENCSHRPRPSSKDRYCAPEVCEPFLECPVFANHVRGSRPHIADD